MGELQREVRKLGKQADEYEVSRANLEMAAEQRVAARQRQCEAEMERLVERASAAEAHAQHMSAQLEAAHARAAAEREGHARAQERLELQLAQCRERLVSRTEQLLTLETMEEGGEHADAQAAVSAAAAQIAQELRRVT